MLSRRETKDEIVKAVQIFNDAGIRTSSFNMFGIPFETRETLMETVEINRRAKVRYPNVGFFFPLPGTPLKDIAIKGGFIGQDFDGLYQDGVPSLSFPDMTSDQLIKFIERFLLFIKLPKTMWPFIERSEGDDQIAFELTQELQLIYEESVFANESFYQDDGQDGNYLKRLSAIWTPSKD